MSLPVSIRVWRRRTAGDWGLVSVLEKWEHFEVEPRHNDAGPWTLGIPFGAQVFRLEKDDLITFDLRGTRFTGAIEDFGATAGEDGRPVLEVVGRDALSWLSDATVWPTPDADLADQTEVRWYAEGPAETLIRDVITAQLVDRLGYDITLAPDEARGEDVIVSASFTSLLDEVTKAATLGGIGVRMGLVETTSAARAAMTVDFYTPADKSVRVRLSHRVGSLQSWKVSDHIPAATRAVVQAAKEQTGREVASVNITTNAITTTEPHRLRTGDIVTFTGGTTLPSPLLTGVAYIAIRNDADSFKVAQTRELASERTEINLTTTGSGTITATESTRRYRLVTDPEPEAEWGRVREILVDGEGEDGPRKLDATGREALIDGAGQSGFELETAEPEGMRYGTHYGLGDTVTVELVTGLAKPATLGAVRVAGGAEGITFQAVPGNPNATRPLFRLAGTIRALRRQATTARED